MKKLLYTEKIGDRTEWWWLHTASDGTDRITVETVQDCEPILEANKRAYNGASTRFGDGLMHKVAEIPGTIIEEMCRLRQISFQELMQNKSDHARAVWNEMLNASEFRSFRTRPGRVDMQRKAMT